MLREWVVSTLHSFYLTAFSSARPGIQTEHLAGKKLLLFHFILQGISPVESDGEGEASPIAVGIYYIVVVFLACMCMTFLVAVHTFGCRSSRIFPLMDYDYFLCYATNP